jgi:hypothetical protein
MSSKELYDAIKSLMLMAANHADEYSLVLSDSQLECLELYEALNNKHIKDELYFLNRLSKTENKNGT